MCNFCDDLKYREIIIPMRTSMADDNVCEMIVNDDCEKCNHGCADENHYFSITTWEDNLCLNYFHKIGELIIAPVSTRFSINFCPMCGKQITEKINDKLGFW